MTVLFLDTNIPMYAAGEDHPLKEPCRAVLRIAGRHATSFASDAEVLQEILHRFLSQRRNDAARTLVQRFAELMTGRLASVQPEDVQAAALMAGDHPDLSARDLLHLAVMARLSIVHIVTADAGFGGVPEVRRLDPMDVEGWALELGLLP